MTASSNQRAGDNIQQLYELSTAIGQSNELKPNCEKFIDALVSCFALDAAAVWISKAQIRDLREKDGYLNVHDVPPCGNDLSQKNHILTKLKDHPVLVFRCPKRLSQAISNSDDYSGAVITAFKLGTLGLLIMVRHDDILASAKERAYQLEDVVNKFAISIKSNISYQNLEHEFRLKSVAEQELRIISKFPLENPNVVMRVSTLGRILFANQSAQPILDEMKIGINDKVSSKLMRFVKEIINTRPDREFELFSAGRFYDFNLIHIADGRYINLYGRDVTKKKVAEAALNESEASTKLILNNALEAVININTEGKVIYWNHQAETCFGFTESEAIGSKLSELIIPEEKRAAHDQGMQHYLKTGQGPVLNKRIEFEAIHKTGRRFMVEITVIPVTTARDQYFSSFVRDITEQTEAKRALQKSEARYRDLIDNASDMIYRADPLGFCTFVNPVAQKFMAREEQDLIGCHFSEFVRKDYRQQVTSFYMHQFQKNEDISYLEFPVINAQGKELWVGQNVQVVRETGRITGFTAVARDVTVRVQLLKQLKHSEEKYRGIIESINMGLLEVNKEHQVIYANQAFCRMTGYTFDELKGKVANKLIMDEQHRTQFVLDRKELVKRKQAVHEVKLHRKDGSTFWCLVSGAPMFGNNGEPIGAISINLDITDRKNAEEKIKNALDKERDLGELKSRFVSMASHEFRTPLTTIRSNVELLQFHLEAADVKIINKLKKNFQRIESEIFRLTELMNDVLTIGRIESGKIEFKPISTDLVQFCEDIINQSFSNQKDYRKIRFKVAGKPYPNQIDPNLFNHVVTNLISNAFKYSASQKNPQMELHFKPHSTRLVVKDYGIGIPQGELPKLFESFYRAQNVENIQGTGLGLSIVKQFVEIHGASISVKSTINKGSTFTVTLPQK